MTYPFLSPLNMPLPGSKNDRKERIKIKMEISEATGSFEF